MKTNQPSHVVPPLGGIHRPTLLQRSFPSHALFRLKAGLHAVLALAIVSSAHADLAAPNPGNLIGGATAPSTCGDPAASFGVNIISGDASRTVTDLVVPGAVGGPYTLTRYGHSRYINSQTRFFGFGNNWRHNWQWEVGSVTSGGNPGFAIYFPDGTTKNFWKVSGTSNPTIYAEEANQGGRVSEASGLGTLTLTQPDGWRYTFNKVTTYQYVNGQYVQVVNYHMVSSLPPGGSATTLIWDSYNNRVYQVREPGGRYLVFNYSTQSHTNDTYYDLRGSNSISGPDGSGWYEFTTTSAGATARRGFRYVGPMSQEIGGQPNANYSQIADVRFLDETGAEITTGSIISGGSFDADTTAAKAFDSDANTYFKADTVTGGYAGRYIATAQGSARKCATIRFRPVAGHDPALGRFEAFDAVPQTSAVISSVFTMGGGFSASVNYSYTVQADEDQPTLFSTPVLSTVTVSADVTANYTYKQQASLVRPVLETADDKRVDGSLTKGKWEYWPLYEPNASNFSTSPVGVIKRVLWNNNGTYTEVCQIGDESGEHVARFPTVAPNTGDTDWRVTATATSWGLPTQKKDPLGRTTTFSYHRYDGSAWVASDTGYLKEVKEPGATSGTFRTTTYTHTLIGNVLTATHPDGSVDTYVRSNALELPTSHTLSHAGQSPAFTSRTTTFAYDSSQRLTTVTHPDGKTEGYTYNTLCLPLTHTLRNGFTESFAYGTTGLMTSRTDAEGNVTTLNYQYSGDRVSSVVVTRAPGDTLTTSYAYNARHQVTTVTHPGNKTNVFTYDLYGNRLTSKNELNNIWTTTYDALRRKLTESDPLARTTSYSYDPPGGGGGCCGGGGGSGHLHEITMPSGKKVAYDYDKAGARTKDIAAPGTADEATTTSAYNANDGTLTSITDPRGKTTTFAYDSRKRRSTETNTLGHQTTWTYDAAGNTLSTTNSIGGITTNVHDVMNRITTTTDPANHTTAYQYGRVAQNDGGDTIHKVTDANGNTTTFEHDKLARRTKTIHPAVNGSSAQEVWTYDGVGNVKTYTNRAGAILTNTYDNRNRPTLANWSDTTPDVTTAYDDAGRVTSQTSSVSVLTYTYNTANELLSETQDIAAIDGMSGYNPPARTVSYTYNADGQRATMTYPDGTALAYTYTDRNQLNTITSGGNTLADYDYNLSGDVVLKQMMTGTAAATNSATWRDDLGRVTRLTHGPGAAGEDSALYYGYDNASRTTSRTESNYTINQSKQDAYTYTADSRYDTVRYGVNGASQEKQVNYTHDPAGNRDSVQNIASQSQSYTEDYGPVNPLNQYPSITPSNPYSTPPPATTLGYDTNGNLNSVTQLGETRTLTYDAQNRLLGTNATGDGQTYAYDPSGRVAYRIINGTLRVQTWTGSALIEDRDATGTQLAEYIQGGTGELLSKESAGTKSYYHHDAQGNVIALTNPTGAIVERYRYDVFGNVTILDASAVPLSPQVSAYGNRWMWSEWEQLAMTGMGQLGVYDTVRGNYCSEIGCYCQPSLPSQPPPTALVPGQKTPLGDYVGPGNKENNCAGHAVGEENAFNLDAVAFKNRGCRPVPENEECTEDEHRVIVFIFTFSAGPNKGRQAGKQFHVIGQECGTGTYHHQTGAGEGSAVFNNIEDPISAGVAYMQALAAKLNLPIKENNIGVSTIHFCCPCAY